MKHLIKGLALIMLSFFAASIAKAGGDVISVNGKNYTLHVVKPNETLYAIAQTVNIDVAELAKVNRLNTDAAVKANDILIVPLYAKNKQAETNAAKTNKQTEKAAEGSKTPTNANATEHTVKAGETLYGVARLYNTTPDALRKLNNLTVDGLKLGQQLKIPASKKEAPTTIKQEAKPAMVAETKNAPTKNSEPAAPVPTNAETKPDATLDIKMMNGLKNNYDKQANGNATLEAVRGVAALMQEGSGENQTRFYALHKTAPIGKVLKVRNTMNNKTTYVKVIGKLPETSENQNVIIKVSAGVAKYLNVLDTKFQAEVSEYK